MRFNLQRRKRPNEKFSIGIDFTPDLEVGDSVSSKAVTAFADGLDVTSTFIASSSLTGSIVGALIQVGADGQQVRVIFKATTTLGRIYEHEILVEVNAAG